jgi:membrane protein
VLGPGSGEIDPRRGTLKERGSILLFGHRWSLAGVPGAALYVLGIVGLALMPTAIYMVLPVGQVAFRHALIGGITATLSWEIVRHLLVWYFATLSMVNLVYGSLATAIIVLLTLEAGAVRRGGDRRAGAAEKGQ